MKIKTLLSEIQTLALSALVAIGLPAFGQTQFISKQHTNATAAEVIFPAPNLGTFKLQCLEIQTDTNLGLLRYYGGTAQTSTGAALTTDTNLFVQSTANFVSNDIVVVQLPDGTVFSRQVWGTNGGTNIAFTATLGTAVLTNSTAYRMSQVHLQPVGTTNTVRFSAPLIFSPNKQYPCMVRLSGASAANIWNASGHVDPAQ